MHSFMSEGTEDSIEFTPSPGKESIGGPPRPPFGELQNHGTSVTGSNGYVTPRPKKNSLPVDKENSKDSSTASASTSRARPEQPATSTAGGGSGQAMMVSGVQVNFPRKPYSQQLAISNGCIKAIKLKKNALLESPTGTGKSIALVSSVLAAQEAALRGDGTVENPFQVIYCVRTHAQAEQMLKEVKGSSYPNTTVAIMGSRKHYCMIPTLKKDPKIDEKCRTTVVRLDGGCAYHQNAENLANELQNGGPFDIEDLEYLSAKKQGCPFMANRVNLKEADLVVATYQYLLNRDILESSDIEVQHNVIIFDEAASIYSATGASSMSTSSFSSNSLWTNQEAR